MTTIPRSGCRSEAYGKRCCWCAYDKDDVLCAAYRATTNREVFVDDGGDAE